jgi:hypothetical protein
LADNFDLNAGTGGVTLAADDITGVHHQKVKVEWGANNSVNETAVAAPMPVQLSDGTDVALVSAGGALLTDASATTQPVSHAALTELAAAIDTELQVDVVTSGLPTGASTAAKQDDIITHLATIAGDTTAIEAAVEGTLTIAGTVDLGATDNAVLDAIAASVALLDDATYVDDTATHATGTSKGFLIMGAATPTDTAVSANDIGAIAMTNNRGMHVEVQAILAGDNNIGNVDVASSALPTGASTLAEQQSQTTHLATIAGDTTAIETAIQILDDWDESDRAKVNLIVGQAGIAAGTGTDGATVPRVTLATNVALPAGTNGIGKLTANSGVDIGDVDVTSISAGTNAIGNVGLIGRTTGGMTAFNSIDLDESEEEIKNAAGQIFSIAAFNHTTAPLYLRFYNATAANTTVGSTAALVGPFTVPANADSDGAGFIWNNEIGFAFSTAISAAVTTGIAANDTGAPAANACSVVVGYV